MNDNILDKSFNIIATKMSFNNPLWCVMYIHPVLLVYLICNISGIDNLEYSDVVFEALKTYIKNNHIRTKFKKLYFPKKKKETVIKELFELEMFELWLCGLIINKGGS